MTPPAPTRSTPAGRAYLDLRNRAKRDGRDSMEYFTLYALEGFLTRLADSQYAEDFTLKGGVLMAAFAARRPTRDIDLAACGFPNDIPDVELRIRSIVAQDTGDGLTFDPAAVSGAPIRDEAAYAGVRVHMAATLATAHIPLHADVNFGDPIWPAPTITELPLLLGGHLRLRGYPDHMVLAEKIVTAIDRGDQNTRWRDFVDIAAITGSRRVLDTDLHHAIDTVAVHRTITVRPLAEVLDGFPALAQSRWRAWRRKQRLEASTPERFGDLLNACMAFADPVLHATASGRIWEPELREWRPPASPPRSG